MFCLYFYAVDSADNHAHDCMCTHLGHCAGILTFNPLTPNDPYRGHTAPLTSKVAFYIFIQQI